MLIAPPGKRRGRPRTNACETCRSAKVKCDEQAPCCSRCSRLDLLCRWPEDRTSSQSPTRLQTGKARILPRPSRHSPRIIPVGWQDSYESDINGYDLDNASVVNSMSGLLNTCNEAAETGPHISSGPSLTDSSRLTGILTSTTWLTHDILLDDDLVLSGDEYHALSHYKNHFISTKLLKTPRWSTYGCILQSILHVPMAMHFLLALSSLDLIQRSPHPTISIDVIRIHLQKGSEMLIRQMDHHTEPHHLSTLISFLFLYTCMIRRDILNETVINKLNRTILNYIKRYHLEHLGAGITSLVEQQLPLFDQKISPIEAGLIGRVLLFLMATDTFSSIAGCGGHLATYLCSDEDVFWRIFISQRYILERFWGTSYPDHEILHDLETTAVMELHYKTLKLIQRMNELNRKPDEVMARDSDIERKMAEVERDFSSILRLARSQTIPISSLVQNAEVVVAAFYFMQIYYFRLTLEDNTQPTPPHIINAMTDAMNAAYRTFGRGDLGYDLFRMPLFMVGIETRDQIHVKWILTWLSSLRMGIALQQIIAIQQQTSVRLGMGQVRRILRSPLSPI